VSRLYLAIDGGGSTCRARIGTAAGAILGEGLGGPANISLDLDFAVGSIAAATRAAIAAAGLSEDDTPRLHAVLGMAGGNVATAAAALLAAPLPFGERFVTSDAETACAGAHAGAPGAILILGTGSQGYGRRDDGSSYRVGGWGFALSDGGSGAVVGQRAARAALAAHEGLRPASPFTRALMAEFGSEPAELLAFALKAISRDWARLTPMLFDYAAAGDPVALELRDEAVAEVDGLVERLVALGAARVALVGGLAGSYRPLTAPYLSGLITLPEGDALDGGLALARARWPEN
jgi:glucosamine kinase